MVVIEDVVNQGALTYSGGIPTEMVRVRDVINFKFRWRTLEIGEWH